MCMFSVPVADVESTQIYARHLDSGDQALVYSMSVKLTEPTAMILPLPVPPNPGDDAIRFVDLSGYPRFFTDMAHAFPVPESRGRFAPASGGMARNATLKVHKVGSFVASFVPSLAEFSRLDTRFQLPDEVWSILPYDDWGFAVFQLDETTRNKEGFLSRLFGGSKVAAPWVSEKKTIHPMAFVFPRRDPNTLFFPTLHVHDGAVRPKAKFDHFLYAQPSAITAATFSWERSASNLGASLDADRAQSLIDADNPVFRKMLHGQLPNRDVVLTPPSVSLETLRPTHNLFELRLHAYPAYFDPDIKEPGATQRRVARDHLPVVSAELCRQLEMFHASMADSCGLIERNDSLRELSMVSSTDPLGEVTYLFLEPGQPFPPRAGSPSPGPARVRFGAHHDALGSISITFSFGEVPNGKTYSAIHETLPSVLESVWETLQAVTVS